MTSREQAAFVAGIEAARQMAMVAAVSLEVRDDAGDLRQRAAVAALQGLAEGLSATFLTTPVCIPPEITGKAPTIIETC